MTILALLATACLCDWLIMVFHREHNLMLRIMGLFGTMGLLVVTLAVFKAVW